MIELAQHIEALLLEMPLVMTSMKLFNWVLVHHVPAS